MSVRRLLSAALLALPAPLLAQSSQDFGNRLAKASDAAIGNQFLSFPLPMNNLLAGRWQAGFNGGYSSVDAGLVRLRGGMLSAGGTYAFADHFGAYAFAFGNSQSASGGGVEALVLPFARNVPLALPASAQHSGTRGAARQAGVGAALVWDPLVRGEKSHSMPLYVGAALTQFRLDGLKTDYRVLSGADAGQTGTIDLSGTYNFLMPMLGWQYSRNLGSFQLVPNALFALPLAERPQKGTVTGTAPKVFTISGDTESAGSSGANFSPFIFAVGANLVYRPWGLGANLGATAYKAAVGSALYDGVKRVVQFDLSWRFGNYAR